MAGIGRLQLFALDCRDPWELAGFYSDLTGWRVAGGPADTWIELVSPAGPTLAFQRVEDHRPPVWPGSEVPQQGHVDLLVDDLDEAERQALAIGAVKAGYQPSERFRVFFDPAGHPFCLVLDTTVAT